MKILKILLFKLGFYWNGCGRFKIVKRRRQNSAYENDSCNYNTLCIQCYELREKYWEEQWDIYNSGRF